jgi:hypothetical protein
VCAVHVVQCVPAGDLDGEGPIQQRIEDVGGSAADGGAVGQVVRQPPPRQEERPGVAQFNRVEVAKRSGTQLRKRNIRRDEGGQRQCAHFCLIDCASLIGGLNMLYDLSLRRRTTLDGTLFSRQWSFISRLRLRNEVA